MFRTIAGVLVASMLAGCSLLRNDHPQVVNPAPPGIAYRVHSVGEARSEAERYCGEWHKQAKLSKISPSGTEKIASFDCV